MAVGAGGLGEFACGVIAVAGALAQGQGFLGDAVVAVKAEGVDVAQRVGDLDEVATGVVAVIAFYRWRRCSASSKMSSLVRRPRP